MRGTGPRLVSSVGVDLVELKKARAFYTRHKSRLVSFFHPEELAYIRTQRSRTRAVATLLAAKEAVFKASGLDWMGPSGFRDIRLSASGGELKLIHASLGSRLRLECLSHKDFVVVRCAGI